MKKALLTVLALCVIVITANSQVGFQWVQTDGTPLLNDQGKSVAADAAGNTYVAGFFTGTVDFDPGPGAITLSAIGSNTTDAFVAKYDAAGIVQWAVNMGGTANDLANSITIDAAGDILITGSYIGIADFDPSVGVHNLASGDAVNPSAFVCKISSAGTFIWAAGLGNGANSTGNSIATDAAGNVYTTGQFLLPGDFDPGAGTSTLTGKGVFVSKLDALGNYVTALKLGGASTFDVGTAIQIDGSGNIIIAGQFIGTSDFDPSVGTHNLTASSAVEDIFITKLDGSGNFLWAGRIGGTFFDAAHGMAIDALDNILVSGVFESVDGDFDPGAGTFLLTKAGGTDNGFVVNISPGGNLVWAKNIITDTNLHGGEGSVNSIAVDATGIYAVGSFDRTADFDPGTGIFELSAFGSDIFISKLDLSGNFMWALRLGAAGIDVAQGVALGSGNILTTGSYLSTGLDFDPTSGTTFRSAGSAQDMFTVALSQNGPPTITSFTPTTGPVGTTVTITGTNFGLSQAYNQILFNGTPSTVVTVDSPTSIRANVPGSTTTGPISITVGGLTGTSSADFVVSVPSTITGFSPAAGPISSTVTIDGTGFSTTKTDNVVSFNGTSATVTAATATQLKVTVPTGATSGLITISVGGGPTVATMSGFTVNNDPAITGFNPDNGPVGALITILGVNFSTTAANNAVIFYNGVAALVQNATATQLSVQVPAGAATGPVTVTVAGVTVTSPSDFTVLPPPPTITSFNPTSGPVGATVTITGLNYDATPANNTVKFNGVNAVVTASTPTSLTVTVPVGATFGKISVTVGGQTVTTGLNFLVTPTPTIASFSPTSGTVNTTVTISGTNYDVTLANNTVKFNGTTASITSGSFAAGSTSLTVKVPAGATTGPISITIKGLTITSASDFTVISPPPTITSFNPTSGPVGTSVTITGTNFDGSTATNNIVKFNGTTAVVTASTATSITTTVPTGATTGAITVTVGGQTVTSSSNFTVTIPISTNPTVASFNPTNGPVGTAVTITGTNFDATAGNNTVTFNGITANVTASTSTSITAIVPTGATTGSISVTVAGQTGTSTSNFTVTTTLVVSPSITSFNPATGPIGTTVTITGTNFDATATNNTVSLNGVLATVTSSTTTSITTSVPTGATTGPISVIVGGQAATSATNFTVTYVDNTPPVVANTSAPAASTVGQPINISVALSDAESGVVNANLMYRYISSDQNFTSLPMVHSGGQTYTQTIPSSTSDELGVEYTYDVTNGAGLKNPQTLYRVGVTYGGNGLQIPYASAGSDVSNYRIVSVPLDLSANSLGNVFDELGAIDNTKWRMWHYANGQNSELDLSSTIVAGSGYWLISRTDPGQLFSGAGSTVAVSLDAPFSIDLKAGWNQIGNPYNFILNWADVQAANTGLPGLTKFVDTFVDATTLDKMEGGFIYVAADQRITIPVIKDKSLNGGRVAANGREYENSLDQANWQVDLHLSHGKLRNEIAGFGMNEKASANLDVYDGVTMPRFFGQWLEINHSRLDNAPMLSRNIVPSAGNHIWEFSVETSEADPRMTLTWDNSYFGNNGPELYLWDNALQYGVDMRTVNNYTFDRKTSGSFKIVFGSAAFVRQQLQVTEFALRSVWPNPANLDNDVTISVLIPDTDEQLPVSIVAIDVLGQKTWTFEGTLPAGSHDVKWKLSGHEANGVYIIKVKRGLSEKFTRVLIRR